MHIMHIWFYATFFYLFMENSLEEKKYGGLKKFFSKFI